MIYLLPTRVYFQSVFGWYRKKFGPFRLFIVQKGLKASPRNLLLSDGNNSDDTFVTEQ